MPIQVLPPQLANQIAAGEVVERPASVVKELVENSLDAGATRIEIDIERGGAKRIRIRDNGSGIDKDELALALARHATSKIASLDDLETITSMGFRGEALASVSAVSRLTLTSRTAAQGEAWQAYAEGRDLAVTQKPAAHPVGTTVEVLDLFYNTPARRKFMRTEKTEFTHIDEVIRRIALARFDVTFILQHNGKTVRQYRAISQPGQHLRRLGALCGPAFVERALSVSWQHGDLAIHGWVADQSGGELPEMQYSYVNRRTMRDKLINHAIRQAYQEQLAGTQQPAFVLFLDVEPHQVDVNVHPAKHEVRFHQARLVHDFIYQAVMIVLQQSTPPGLAMGEEGPCAPENRLASGRNHFALPAASGQRPSVAAGAESGRQRGEISGDTGSSRQHSGGQERERSSGYAGGAGFKRKEGALYRQLMQTAPLPQGAQTAQRDIFAKRRPAEGGWSAADDAPLSADDAGHAGTSQVSGAHHGQSEKEVQLTLIPPEADPTGAASVKRDSGAAHVSVGESVVGNPHTFGRVLTLVPPCYALVESAGSLALLSLQVAERCLTERQLTPGSETLSAQPLLIPLRMTLRNAEVAALKRHQPLLQEMGIALQAHLHQAILNAVPLPLRQQNLQNLIPDLLGYLEGETSVTHHQVAVWLARRLQHESVAWSHSRAIQLLAEVERLCPQWVKAPPDGLLVTLNFEAAIKALNHD
ncbi:DNA mismatch repair protein MutL [Sodalis glossinidius str. 'morsitans']|uniref:DNA mismatch repair protein MutL n=1 Tax=Sodalis glossinidius (strain morsitans) TaxID=343509 RepID=A0A193QFR2_SODGM|nr:DNA mismatch repair endonuclease MutL [Sodalis glossinidius]CRL44011.1 DNA mismatch repair protein MutL [Sodalis glossinidius str. 'morsitans']